MSAAPVKHRTEKNDHPSGVTPEAVAWRATYTYEANGFRYTDEASIRDVSRSGCSIRGRTRLAVGSKTTVTFHLLDQRRPLSVLAKVIRGTGECFGVQFLNLSNGSYERMQQYMQKVMDDPPAADRQTLPLKEERRKANLGFAVLFLILGALGGCGTLPPPVSSPSAPFLIPTAEDRANLTLRASELDAVAEECAAESTCNEQVHFARALVSLFENREAARASFEKVISLHPTSALASSSALWLQVLNEEAHPFTASYRPLLSDMTAQWLRQWMARPIAAPPIQQRTHEPKPALVQALHQQVRERDRHIAHLRAQLDALKVISQEQEERRRAKPRASFGATLESPR